MFDRLYDLLRRPFGPREPADQAPAPRPSTGGLQITLQPDGTLSIQPDGHGTYPSEEHCSDTLLTRYTAPIQIRNQPHTRSADISSEAVPPNPGVPLTTPAAVGQPRSTADLNQAHSGTLGAPQVTAIARVTQPEFEAGESLGRIASHVPALI